jgi:hypothetical protein
MNHVVFLDAQAGELEKILSGVKTMLVKEFDPAQTAVHLVSAGDSLYFVRNKEVWALRVKATVIRVLISANCPEEDLSHTLKEMQPKLQLTEDQYSYWSAKQHVVLVEFESARKIDVIHVAPNQIADCTDWIAFEAFGLIMHKEIDANIEASSQ